MQKWKIADVLTVNEIFHSIQGESTRAGQPCVFVRLTACDLRCTWCDTPYAFHEGRRMSIDDVVKAVEEYGCPLVEVTGGEPLLFSPVHGTLDPQALSEWVLADRLPVQVQLQLHKFIWHPQTRGV